MAIAALVPAISAIGGAVATAAPYISLATSAAGGLLSYQQNEAQIKQQKKYNEAVNKDTVRKYSELTQAESDAIEASHKNSLQLQRERLREMSQVQVQAAASGTGGTTIDLALKDINKNYGDRIGEINYNQSRQLDNIDKQAVSLKEGAKRQYDYTIQKPSWLSGASTAISTYTTMSPLTKRLGRDLKESAQAIRS